MIKPSEMIKIKVSIKTLQDISYGKIKSILTPVQLQVGRKIKFYRGEGSTIFEIAKITRSEHFYNRGNSQPGSATLSELGFSDMETFRNFVSEHWDGF